MPRLLQGKMSINYSAIKNKNKQKLKLLTWALTLPVQGYKLSQQLSLARSGHICPQSAPRKAVDDLDHFFLSGELNILGMLLFE